MLNRLVCFQGHIKTERYALNYTTEDALRKQYERYINPSCVVAVEQRTDSAFEAQQLMFVSAREYCRIWTVNGAFDVDGTLNEVVNTLMTAAGVEATVRSQPR